MPDRNAVEGAIDYTVLQAGAAPSSRIGAAGWIQGVGYDWLQGRINSGSGLGSRGWILNKLIQDGFGGTFIVPFNDKGSGEVDLVPLVGTGSATFTRATTATTVDSAGLIVSVASGTPRSYYDPTTLQYLGYLSEGARTNLCLQSNAFTTTWTQFSGTASFSQNVTGPDGVSNSAWTITDPGAATVGPTQTIALTNATTYSLSVFIKKTTGALTNYPALTAYNASYSVGCVVDTTAGTATAITSYQGATIGTTNGITVQGFEDYWRVSFNFTANASANWLPVLHPAYNATGTGAENTATSGSAVFYGAQLEAGSFASTYIPTTTASVTRNADVLTYPFSGNALDTVGSAYAEMLTFSTTGNGTSSIPLALSASGLMMYLNSSDARTASNLFDGTNSATKTGLSDISTATRKRGCSWGGSGLINTGDGLTPATSSFDGSMGSTSIAVGSTNAGASQWFGTIRNVRIYQTQLTASQLQALTS